LKDANYSDDWRETIIASKETREEGKKQKLVRQSS
jgi:hypothetical protein